MLVKADYSQIELRIAAKVSGDKALLEAYRAREDLHTLTARIVLAREEVTKEDRANWPRRVDFGCYTACNTRGSETTRRVNMVWL